MMRQYLLLCFVVRFNKEEDEAEVADLETGCKKHDGDKLFPRHHLAGDARIPAIVVPVRILH